MRSSSLHIFVLVWAIMLPGYLVGQDDKESDLKSEEVYIFEEYIPTIIEPRKFNTYPRITDTIVIKPDMKHGTLGIRKNIQLKVMPINAARIKGEPIAKLYNGYAKIAGGNFSTILAEASYMTVRNKNYSLGAKINHLSSNDKKLNRFSNSNAEVFGKKFISKKHTLKGGLNYSMDGYEYYKSANYEALNPLVNLKQRYNQYGGNVGFKTFHKDSARLNFGIDYEYLNFQSALDSNLTSSVENLHDFKVFVLSPISKSTFGTAEFKLKTFGLTSFSDISINSLSQVSARAVTINDRLRFEYGFKVFVTHQNGEAGDMKF
ncbi:MAG: hypothetical protein IH948_06280, partial [Bacteroidetes bacterium]|nr:hypothetical protein [Bacteroidota bacterium]